MNFPSSFPPGCPCGATGRDITIYHGCESNPATDEDFTPFANSQSENKRKRALKKGCNGWGISCWIDEKAARHAQELFDWAARWHIFKGDITAADGQIAHTPSRNQNDHYTFWCYEGVNLCARFTWAWAPYKESSK